MKHATLTITGMSCGHCVSSVRNALAALNGVTVQAVRVGEAEILYDPAKVTPSALVEAVTQSGYAAVIRPGADDPAEQPQP